MRRAALLLPLLLTTCAHEVPPPKWAHESSLLLAPSHRCQGGACVCRPLGHPNEQAERAPPPPGSKRFELRLAPTVDAVWIEIAGRGTYFKGGPGEACLYVDLPAGQKTRIAYHVEAAAPVQGVVLDLGIAEYGQKTGAWYRTGEIVCGGGGSGCDRAGLETWIAGIQSLPRGLRDACGSTRLEGAAWKAGETPQPHPIDLSAELVLHVYRFMPVGVPGDASCAPPSTAE